MSFLLLVRSPPPVREGAARLEAPGSFLSDPRRLFTSGADLHGAGALSATAERITPADASLTAPSSLTVSAERDTPGVVSLLGGGALAADAERTTTAEADLRAAARLSARAERTTTGVVSMGAAGSLTASSDRDTPSQAALAAPASLDAAPVVTRIVRALLAAPARLTAVFQRTTTGSADLRAPGSLAAGSAMRSALVGGARLLAPGDLLAEPEMRARRVREVCPGDPVTIQSATFTGRRDDDAGLFHLDTVGFYDWDPPGTAFAQAYSGVDRLGPYSGAWVMEGIPTDLSVRSGRITISNTGDVKMFDGFYFEPILRINNGGEATEVSRTPFRLMENGRAVPTTAVYDWAVSDIAPQPEFGIFFGVARQARVQLQPLPDVGHTGYYAEGPAISRTPRYTTARSTTGTTIRVGSQSVLVRRAYRQGLFIVIEVVNTGAQSVSVSFVGFNADGSTGGFSAGTFLAPGQEHVDVVQATPGGYLEVANGGIQRGVRVYAETEVPTTSWPLEGLLYVDLFVNVNRSMDVRFLPLCAPLRTALSRGRVSFDL